MTIGAPALVLRFGLPRASHTHDNVERALKCGMEGLEEHADQLPSKSA